MSATLKSRSVLVESPTEIDPYYDGVWTRGTQIGWLSRTGAEHARVAGLGGLPARWSVDPVTALQRLTSSRNLPATVDALGAINQWRTISVEQLARVTGRPQLGRIGRRGESLVSSLFAAGLVDFGFPVAPLRRPTMPHPGAVLLRPAMGAAFAHDIAPLLTHAELVRITAGQGYRQARQADRHNLLAVEFAMRAGEHCEVSAALGELTSSVDLLAYSGLGRTAPPGLQASADAVLVRPDGMRVAIEITATVGNRFKRKVDTWAKTLAASPFDMSGLMVLFVEAATLERSEMTGRSVMYDVRKAVQGASRRFPGRHGDRVADRMAVASWHDFFPARHLVDAEQFPLLRAERPSGTGDDVWHPIELLDPFSCPFTSEHAERLQSVISNSRTLAGVPASIVTREHVAAPDLAMRRLREVGFDPLPVPPSATGARRRVEVGIGVGAAREATVPARLVAGRR